MSKTVNILSCEFLQINQQARGLSKNLWVDWTAFIIDSCGLVGVIFSYLVDSCTWTLYNKVNRRFALTNSTYYHEQEISFKIPCLVLHVKWYIPCNLNPWYFWFISGCYAWWTTFNIKQPGLCLETVNLWFNFKRAGMPLGFKLCDLLFVERLAPCCCWSWEN